MIGAAAFAAARRTVRDVSLTQRLDTHEPRVVVEVANGVGNVVPRLVLVRHPARLPVVAFGAHSWCANRS